MNCVQYRYNGREGHWVGSWPTFVHRALLVFVIFLVGCSSSPRGSATGKSRSPILDGLLAPGPIQLRMKEAERDLSTDKWETLPKMGYINSSRSDRESELAHELLATIKPRLKAMSARELLESLKTVPDGACGSFPGVAYYVYRDGNWLIMQELKTRPTSELASFRKFRDDNREVFTGDSGPLLLVGELVRHDLLHEPY
jgi:hypothetical protein